MRNLSSLKIESAIGAILVLGLAIFAIFFMLSATKSTKDEMDATFISASNLKKAVRTSEQEKLLIDTWIIENNIEIPLGEDPYSFVKKTYGSEDWLNQ